MADDEAYWNSTSAVRGFDFDDDPHGVNSENLLKLFAVSLQPPSSPLGHSDDVDLRSTASDDASSVRSDGTNDDIPKATSFARSLVARTRSTLSKTSIVSAASNSSSVAHHSSVSPTFSLPLKVSPKKPQVIQPPEIVVRPRSDSDESGSQLMSEVQYLRRNLEVSRKDQWIKLSAKEMVWRIVRNKPYGLENYRNLEEKLALLDQALNLYDNNAIIIVILHMKHTLNREIFLRELANKPDAMDQYVAFLVGDGKLQECFDILEHIGRFDEATQLQLRLSLQKHHIPDRLKELDSGIKRQLTVASSPASELTRLRTYKSLLEVQRPIDDHDEKASKDPKNDLFVQFPRLRSVIGLSLIDTLHYCCLYHFDKPETNFCSPHYIRRAFAIPEKQFLWTALSALSKAQKWNDIQSLLTDRTGWFGAPKPKSAIGFESVVDVLLRNGTPPDVLAYYLRLIDEPELRLELSRKSKCHSVTIDTLAVLKQFDKLQDFGAKFDPGSAEFQYIQEVLHKAKM
ncbi:spermatogenesis-defective protein 39 homolog [Paramacrobiotus metropolitanus]|uniref:spermatogenesis-defective protein 39 homolog n=1 Tax=Paramacrobiotus metropolitanus TaxID=2943436 RepID=UPI0024459EC9|nr:spermatogenesis-defective protein 39 homolog [Paramacrobiotus metropolitanus]